MADAAEQEISERPAWPRKVHAVPQLPVTAVGNIFKPSLRQDVVDRTHLQWLLGGYL